MSQYDHKNGSKITCTATEMPNNTLSLLTSLIIITISENKYQHHINFNNTTELFQKFYTQQCKAQKYAHA